jgi:hypothetical protein
MLYEWINNIEKDKLYQSMICDFDKDKCNQVGGFESF